MNLGKKYYWSLMQSNLTNACCIFDFKTLHQESDSNKTVECCKHFGTFDLINYSSNNSLDDISTERATNMAKTNIAFL